MVYSSFGSNTPLLTEQILSAIKLLPYIILTAILTVIIGCSLYMLYFRKLPHIRQVKIMLRIPLIKTFLILKHSHYFATQLSGLLNGGLSVCEALTIMMEQRYHPFFQYEANRIERQLIEENSYNLSLLKVGITRKNFLMLLRMDKQMAI